MYYLGFALFFLLYFLVGSFTDWLELTTVGGLIAIAFICLNIYMYIRDKKQNTDAD
ncbi:hypothetical protein [Salimicrobium halophilum]|uniref:Uncharacterized protein n=1 Tax=Salimicrobium halophilum TaxID=86666 RepID=A0A1G8S2C7_9BACI|nr:hypothetical protein [Salimicrobium halophilum]SDJ23434.1 hypothetical protein SAMN04490247_1218 [Salimicrobium halophilum]